MKKHTMRTILTLFVIACFVFTMTACGSGSGGGSGAEGEETVVWKLAHEEYEPDPMNIYAKILQEKLDQNSGGTIQLDVYTVGQLGDGADLFETVKSGTADIGFNSPGVVSTIIPETNVFNLHFLFPTDIHKMQEFLSSDSEAMAKMSALYEEQGVHVLRWVTETGNIWTCNKPLTSPDAFKNVKFRTMVSPVISESYKQYGADTVTIAYTELYSGLQLGMADGQVNPVGSTLTQSYYEVQSDMTISYPDYFIFSVNVNQDFYASLTDEQKEILDKSLEETEQEYLEHIIQDEQDYIAELKDKGMNVTELTPEQVDEFRKIAEANRYNLASYLGDDGDNIIKEFEEELKAYY